MIIWSSIETTFVWIVFVIEGWFQFFDIWTDRPTDKPSTIFLLELQKMDIEVYLYWFLLRYFWTVFLSNMLNQHTGIAKCIKMNLWVYSTWMTSFVSSYVLKSHCLRIWQFVLHSFAGTKTLVLRSFGIGALKTRLLKVSIPQRNFTSIQKT